MVECTALELFFFFSTEQSNIIGGLIFLISV